MAEFAQSLILSAMAGIISYYYLQMVRPKIAHSQLKMKNPEAQSRGFSFCVRTITFAQSLFELTIAQLYCFVKFYLIL